MEHAIGLHDAEAGRMQSRRGYISLQSHGSRLMPTMVITLPRTSVSPVESELGYMCSISGRL